MKSFVLPLILILLMSGKIFSQSYDPSYREVVDSIMTPINKSQITTGILYDRVFPWASLHAFNADTSGYKHFLQASAELYQAAYNKTGMISSERIDTIIRAIAYTNDVVPIGLLYYNFNVIDINALANNLFYKGSDSLMYDVPNRTANPYLLIL